MHKLRLLILLPCLHLASAQSAAPVKRALLVGINLYQPAGTTAQHLAGCQGGRCDLREFPNLNGPVNDVAAMRDLLSSPKFGFAPANIAVLTNPDLPPTQLAFAKVAASQTKHDGLLATMRRYLVDIPNKGDTVVFFYAGHGSLRVNSKGNKLAMMVDGKPSHADSTLVPSDAWTGVHDIRDRETTRIFNDALDKGIKLTVILDSCHSGSFTRGVELGTAYTERSLGYDPVDLNEGPDLLPNGEPRPAPSQRKDNPALIFSAAQQDQTAKERTFGDTPIAHGAFTVALLKALQTLPANTSASVVFRQVRATIEGEGIGDQTPSLDASKDRLAQPLFGGERSDIGKTRAAVIGLGEDGEVLLDAGQLSGIDPGSEFTSIPTGDQSKPIKLRVETLEGLTHSRAKIVLPVGAKLTVGQVFELSKWVPHQVDTLRFWTWPHTLPQASIQSAVQQIGASGFTPVEDPVETPWTDMLAWNGTAWELRHAAISKDTPLGTQHIESSHIQLLGPTLTASALKAHLAPDARLWANLPPPQELYAKLALHESGSLVAEAKTVADADYLLVGSLTADGPQWAWFHKAEYLAGPRAAVTKDHSPGCSTTSKYPVGTDWVLLPDADSLPASSEKLNTYASRLAKTNGWLNLSGSLSGASTANFYSLVFKHLDDKSPLAEDRPARQDDRLRMYLTSTDRVVEKRWVYILDIDCHGKGSLLYPIDTADNRFPNDADSPHTDLELPGSPTLRIGPPFGVDTILLISTQQPLPDPSALEFEGSGTREVKAASRGATDPLAQLLSNTSAGTRGPLPEMPTNWSIDAISLQSIPK
jgi:hypothetical protein